MFAIGAMVAQCFTMMTVLDLALASMLGVVVVLESNLA